MLKKIDHLGIVVHDLNEAIPKYRDLLGMKYLGRETAPDGTVEVAFFAVGESKVELVQPLDNPSVARFLEKRGEGLHHVCYGSDDIEADLARLAEGGARLIDKEPRPGAHGKRIAFVHPASTSGVLVELSQDAEE